MLQSDGQGGAAGLPTADRTPEGAGRFSPGRMHYEIIRSELEEVVGQDHITTEEADRLIYSADWDWLPQMWLDRGQPLTKPDYIVHPESVCRPLTMYAQHINAPEFAMAVTERFPALVGRRVSSAGNLDRRLTGEIFS